MPQRDAFEVVKEFLVDVQEGRTSRSRVHEIRQEVLAVAAKMEKVKRMFPEAARAMGMGEEVGDLLNSLRGGGGGFLRRAALL